MAITIVGLGPGDGRYLTREAWDLLSEADVLYLRTGRHPAAADLPVGKQLVTFDNIYDTAGSFADVYKAITGEIIRLGRLAAKESKTVLYAVPGHPLIGESTVTSIMLAAKQEGLPVTIVPGLSFVEPTLTALGVDGLDGLQLFDALEIAKYNYPPLSTDVALLLGQVYNRLIAGELKLTLMALYPDEHEVTLIHAAGTPAEFVERLPLFEIDHSDHLAHLSALFVPPLPYPSALPALAETVAFLRSPEGCPWDQEQNRQSLRSGFLEEMYEALDAIDVDDPDALSEELGDMLYHLVMQTQIATEQEEFLLSDVIAGINSKLKRRHPHVWGDWEAADSAQVIRNWEALKELEKGDAGKTGSVLDSVPRSLPSLARAQKIQERVKRVGFDWPSLSGVEAKVREELAELESAGNSIDQARELGDVLFSLVNWARWQRLDAEVTLREANRRFEERFRLVETMAVRSGRELSEYDLDGLEALWTEAKSELAKTQNSDGLAG